MTLPFDPSMLAFPIIPKQDSVNVGLSSQRDRSGLVGDSGAVLDEGQRRQFDGEELKGSCSVLYRGRLRASL